MGRSPRRPAGTRVLILAALAAVLATVGFAAPAAATPGPDPYRASVGCDDGSPSGITGYTDTSACATTFATYTQWASTGLRGTYETCAATISDAPNGRMDTITLSCSGLIGGYDCGDAGFLTNRDAAALRARGLVGADPCRFTAAWDVGQSRSAGPFGFLTTADGNTWDVLEDQVVSSGGRQARCLQLSSVFPLLSANTQQGSLTVTQRICKGFDPVEQAYVVTNGTYDPNAGGWQSTGVPQVSVSGANPLIGVANGGPGGTGFTSATRVPAGGKPNGAWEIQVQSIAYIGVGVPLTQGGFIGLQKTLQKTIRITKADLPAV